MAPWSLSAVVLVMESMLRIGSMLQFLGLDYAMAWFEAVVTELDSRTTCY